MPSFASGDVSGGTAPEAFGMVGPSAWLNANGVDIQARMLFQSLATEVRVVAAVWLDEAMHL